MSVENTNVGSGLPDLLVWDGPVWSGNVSNVKWSVPTTVLTLPCTGSEGCAGLGYNSPTSGKLRAICASHKVDIDKHDKVIVAGFSAGHGLNDQLLQDPESRDRIAAFCSFDSYYTGPLPGIKKGYLEFAKLSADAKRVMWSSSSSFTGATYTDCEHAIKPLLDAIDPSSASLPFDLANFLRPPAYVVQRGNFVHAAFGTAYAHTEHAKIVAPIVLEHFISPAIHGGAVKSLMWTVTKAIGAVAVSVGLWKLGQKIASR
jgi:hypothetical protein